MVLLILLSRTFAASRTALHGGVVSQLCSLTLYYSLSLSLSLPRSSLLTHIPLTIQLRPPYGQVAHHRSSAAHTPCLDQSGPSLSPPSLVRPCAPRPTERAASQPVCVSPAYFVSFPRRNPADIYGNVSSSYIAELQASKTVISVSRDILRLQPVLVSRHWFFFVGNIFLAQGFYCNQANSPVTQFHALSSTVNLAVAVLQAPGSALTGSAFKELESGIALFEMAQPGCRVRDDLVRPLGLTSVLGRLIEIALAVLQPFLKRLRDRAFARLTAHANSQSPSSNPAYLPQQQQASTTGSHSPHTTAKDEHEHEDLNLIGAETLLRRVDTSHARTSPVSHPVPLSNLPDGSTSTPSEPVDGLSRSSSVGNSSYNGGPSHHQSPHSTQQQQAQGHVQQHLQPFKPVAQGDATIFATQLPMTLDEAIAVKDAHVSAAGFEADIRAHPSWMADPTFWGGTAVPAGGEGGALFGFASGPANNMMNGPEEFDFDGFLAGIGVANQDDIAGEF